MILKSNCGLIPTEHVCVALAIVSALSTGLALVGSVWWCVIMAFASVASNQSGVNYFERVGKTEDDVLQGAPVMRLFAGMLILVVTLASLVSFIFFVVICNGVYNRRPGLVKAYFIYGIVVTALAAQISVARLFDSGDLLPEILGLLGCALQCLFLVLVYQTYLKLNREALFKKHVQLIES